MIENESTPDDFNADLDRLRRAPPIDVEVGEPPGTDYAAGSPAQKAAGPAPAAGPQMPAQLPAAAAGLVPAVSSTGLEDPSRPGAPLGQGQANGRSQVPAPSSLTSRPPQGILVRPPAGPVEARTDMQSGDLEMETTSNKAEPLV